MASKRARSIQGTVTVCDCIPHAPGACARLNATRLFFYCYQKNIIGPTALSQYVSQPAAYLPPSLRKLSGYRANALILDLRSSSIVENRPSLPFSSLKNPAPYTRSACLGSKGKRWRQEKGQKETERYVRGGGGWRVPMYWAWLISREMFIVLKQRLILGR